MDDKGKLKSGSLIGSEKDELNIPTDIFLTKN